MEEEKVTLGVAIALLHKGMEVAFATSEGNLPRIRVFQIMKREGETLYFATAPQKEVHKQLLQNPNVELLVMQEGISVRCSGGATFDVPETMQRWIYENNPVLERLYSNYTKLVYFSLPIATLDYYDLRPTPPILRHFDLQAGTAHDGFVGERFTKQ